VLVGLLLYMLFIYLLSIPFYFLSIRVCDRVCIGWLRCKFALPRRCLRYGLGLGLCFRVILPNTAPIVIV